MFNQHNVLYYRACLNQYKQSLRNSLRPIDEQGNLADLLHVSCFCPSGIQLIPFPVVIDVRFNWRKLTEPAK
jgi:hypothetical protein